ncbi:hypothetical protein POTOM_003791 [Populus tomentosa]|uniref:Uncharacterized protein n=1 Tax=Populus tomentosa TaxID=118781 RepID=A0A8X8D541_POPTO|nr:hypothetical protein POTOM_003791 [Populus tomentosa]
MKLSPSLLISLLPKRFIKTAPSPTTTPRPTRSNTTSSSPSSFTLQFLVNSCGLPLETALTASKKFHLNEKNIHKTQSFASFLEISPLCGHPYRRSDKKDARFPWRFSALQAMPSNIAILGEENEDYRGIFINTVDLGPEILLVYPSLFCLSVDKRIRPCEKKFLENYVDKYVDDVPGLWEVYTGTANTKKKGT